MGTKLIGGEVAGVALGDAAEVEAHAGAADESIWLDSSVKVESLPGFAEGWFAVQDESAIQVSRLLDPKSGEATRVGFRIENGEKVRYAKKSGETIDG